MRGSKYTVEQRAISLLRRYGLRAEEIARQREDAAETEATALHYQRVGDEIDRRRALAREGGR